MWGTPDMAVELRCALDPVTFAVKRLDDCRCCVKKEYPYLEAKESGATTVLCGRNAVQVTPAARVTLNLEEIEKRLAPLGEAKRNEFLVKAKIESYELTVFPDGRAIIKGTDDPAKARTIYTKYVGA